jgi:hypothetical protein
MGKTDNWFWSTEPRVLFALIEKKAKMERIEKKNLACYIASCVWGKDPNELDGQDKETVKNKKIAGRDFPIDPMKLRGL